ncbi:MAG: C-terminal helicase domain-containing protein, partial [Anaerolineae bacterium]|nr:C-terminal helicase domain-containing protein [Anaerolineae bacterium]
LEAFEQSPYIEDWRDLMRLYMVRRTRTFIQNNYAQVDEQGRKYLVFPDGRRQHFPRRVPKTVRFEIDPQYERLYGDEVVDAINDLCLPRYGLGNYVSPHPPQAPTSDEARILHDLSRAGPRLKGFCRTGLFKRLESSGRVFLQSVERHVLRNHVFLFALERRLPLPIGTQDAALLDTRMSDADADELFATGIGEEDEELTSAGEFAPVGEETDLGARAERAYRLYSTQYRARFRWLRPSFFQPQLEEDLRRDTETLQRILDRYGVWDPASDAKLQALYNLVTQRHPGEKVLVFTQYADTARYLETQLQVLGVEQLAGVCGDSEDPTCLAFRFSPQSNELVGQVAPERELRVLIATDVLSEGQNLQDCAIVVNYDLPWAIIRLTQRVGRVDRIGQRAREIACHTFLPAEGVERIIRLRARLRQRLRENAEVLGTDEAFFEDEDAPQTLVDLYNEQAGLLDGEEDTEVDLTSQAYQIWKNAVACD